MFAPIVTLTRQMVGDLKFKRTRAKVIALHAKAITNFCNQFGIERTTRQNMIRLARNNGERLGLLA